MRTRIVLVLIILAVAFLGWRLLGEERNASKAPSAQTPEREAAPASDGGGFDPTERSALEAADYDHSQEGVTADTQATERIVDGERMIRAVTRDGKVIWIPPAPDDDAYRARDEDEDNGDWALPGP